MPYSPNLLTVVRAGVVGLTAVVASLGTGCSPAKVASDPPPHHTGAPVVDLSAPPGGFYNVDKATADGLTQVTANRPVPPGQGRPLNILAMSGGGQFGSYAAGMLVGWTCRGDRPDFDIVTGISSGATLACLAFCGPKYDPVLQSGYTDLTNDEVISSRRLVRNVVRYQALATAEPLKGIIDETINEEYMEDLRAGHRAGRRLYLGTMILNTRRIVYWDMGALACGSDPAKAHRLVKDIILASASIPGMMPAVPIDVQVNGQCVTELHVDGGGISQVFVRFGEHHPRPDPANPGAPWLAGSNLYVIAGGKLYPEVLEPDLGVIPRITSTVSGTLFALFRSDVWKAFTFCRVSGTNFYLSAVPDEVPISPSSMDFDPQLQLELFTVGVDRIRCGNAWRVTPPGYEPGEEDHPRTGRCFHVPNPRTVSGPLVRERRMRGLSSMTH